MRKIFFVTIALVCMVSFLCLHSANSRANDNKVTTESSITFGNAGHPEFFRYQAYKVAHGGAGYTETTWNNLSINEKVRELTDGETELASIKTTLLAKLTPTPKEIELFAAVWGNDAKSEMPTDSTFARYQQYLLVQGQAIDGFDAMPSDVRKQKITEYGIFLESLKTELTTKPVLGTREVELYEAIWGNTQTEKHSAEIAREAEIKEKMKAGHSKKLEDTSAGKLSQDLPQYQQNGNWDRFFDGSANKKGVVDMSGLRLPKRDTKVATLTTETKSRPVSIPPLGSQSQAPDRNTKTGLLLGGGILLAIGAFAFGTKKYVNAKNVKMPVDEFDLDIRINKSDDPPHPNLSHSKAFCGDCPSAPENTCRTCEVNDTCKDECFSHGGYPHKTCTIW